MTRTYDGEKHVALEAERTRLQDAIQAVAVKMNDAYESDAWGGEDGPAKMAAYHADNIHHMQLSRELTDIDRQIDKMEAVRPVSKAEIRANPMIDLRRRFFRNGAAGLDEGERQIFCQEPSDEIMKDYERRGIVPVAGVEIFDPWGIATENGAQPLPARGARMAVGDPSRSDITTESATGAGDALGEAAPETWAAGVVESLQYFGSVASNCHNFTTGNGNSFHQNQLDTKDREGTLLQNQSQTENEGRISGTATTIGNAGDIEFGASWIVSGNIDARIETFDDIHFDMAGRIMREMERRIGRGWNRQFTIGSGTHNSNTRPQGIALSGKRVAGGAGSADDGTGGIDYENLLDMEYAIDLAYLENGEGGEGGFMDAHGGMIGWMMHRNVEQQLRFAVYPGTAGLPIWVPDPTNMGIASQRAPARILGYPYTINQHMGTGKAATDYSVNDTNWSTGTNVDEITPLLFGACGHFAVRNIGGPQYHRFFDSGTSDRMAIRFTGYSRRDSRSRGPHDGTTNLNEAYCVLSVAA